MMAKSGFGLYGRPFRRESEAMSTDPIKSPCKRLCAVDGRLGFCLGCGRTLKEIGGWSQYSHEERDVIMDELAGRFSEKGLALPE